MAQTSTVYNFAISLSNVDRGVYEDLKLSVARHPSETLPYLLTRVLAYCLEYQEGISFSKGLSESDEPAVWAHDLTGQLLLWVEVGSPSAERLHRAAKLGVRVVVYTHKDPQLLIAQLTREKIYAAEQIKIFAFPNSFLEEFGSLVDKRSTLSLSVSENQLYLSIAGKDLQVPLQELSLS